MAYIRTCVRNVGVVRRPVRNNCPSSLIIDDSILFQIYLYLSVKNKINPFNKKLDSDLNRQKSRLVPNSYLYINLQA